MVLDNETANQTFDKLITHRGITYSVTFVLYCAKIFIHLAGFLCLAVNAGYLKCTSSLSSVSLQSMKHTCPERCCKLRNRFACNLFILCHTILLAAEAIAALICMSPPISDGLLAVSFWSLVLWDYILLFVFTLIGSCNGTRKSHAHVGCVHALNIFECVNLVVCWTMVFIMASFFARSHFPQPFKGLASGYGVIPLAISYIAMLLGAYKNYDSYSIHKKVIPKTEAVDKMNKVIQDKPMIEWHIKCRRYGGDGKLNLNLIFFMLSNHFQVIGRESRHGIPTKFLDLFATRNFRFV